MQSIQNLHDWFGNLYICKILTGGRTSSNLGLANVLFKSLNHYDNMVFIALVDYNQFTKENLSIVKYLIMIIAG